MILENQLWLAWCDDVDCWSCSEERGHEVVVSSPTDWEEETLVRRLQVLGHTCPEGNPFYGVVRVEDSSLVPDITVMV